MQHEKIIIANWKMNLLPHEEKTLLASYRSLASSKKIIIAPSFLSLKEMSLTLADKKGFSLCAQTCSPYETGAYTGDISAAQLAALGVQFCLVGHSERRKYWCEGETTILQQTNQLLKQKMTPVVCLEDPAKESSFLEKAMSLAALYPSANIYFAFEPVGAIGTGRTPSPEEIKAAILPLKKALANLPGTQPHILYGGSVSAENAHQIMNIEGIGGLLVGGKSLNFQELKKIVD